MNKKENLGAIKVFSKEYFRSRKKDKGVLLNQLSENTGYSRKYLMELLVSLSKRKKKKKIKTKEKFSKFLPVLKTLKSLWRISNYSCGKRLAPIISVYLKSLEEHEKWKLSKEEKKLLLSISPATTDRLLKNEKKKIQIRLKNRARTKPGTLLKHQIPIRTFADWDKTKVGFLEIDSVHHCGNSLNGDYAYTLDAVDISTGWNECAAHLGRGERRTVEAMEAIRARLPFPLLGVDFDSGGEFVNYHFIRYSQRNKITYTRAREGKKNDQSYIEQQNYSVVRRFVGYQRIDTFKEIKTLNKLYLKLSDYQNFFQPVMRLKEKTRNGARVKRIYDKPKTAYQRVLEHPEISKEIKQKLRQRFKTLNPKKLLLEITVLGRKLSEN